MEETGVEGFSVHDEVTGTSGTGRDTEDTDVVRAVLLTQMEGTL